MEKWGGEGEAEQKNEENAILRNRWLRSEPSVSLLSVVDYQLRSPLSGENSTEVTLFNMGTPALRSLASSLETNPEPFSSVL